MYRYCQPVGGYLLTGDGRGAKRILCDGAAYFPIRIIIGLGKPGLSYNFLPIFSVSFGLSCGF